MELLDWSWHLIRKLLITNWRSVINGPLTQITSILQKSGTLLMFCWEKKQTFEVRPMTRMVSVLVAFKSSEFGLFVFYLEPVLPLGQTWSWVNFVYLNQYNMTAFYNKKNLNEKEEFSQSQRNYYKWLSNFKSFMKNFNSILFCIYEERGKFEKSIVSLFAIVAFQKFPVKYKWKKHFLNLREAFCWYQDELEQLVIYQHFVTKSQYVQSKLPVIL